MTKKLIAIDLDGTTLNAHSHITKRTEAVLQKAIAAGNVVSIATGRPYRMSAQFYQQLNLTSPMVNFNGALVHLPNKEWAYEKELSIKKEIAFSILEQKQALNLDFIAAENRESFYVDRIDGIEPQFFATDRILSANLMKNLSSDPTSLLLKTTHEYAATTSARLMSEFKDDIDVRTWGGPNAILEVVPKGVQKAIGVDIIARSLGIAQKDVIAFGDEHNDVELLDYAGWGVAMKNGTDQLKSYANDITERTNDEDGLADYLESYLAL